MIPLRVDVFKVVEAPLEEGFLSSALTAAWGVAAAASARAPGFSASVGSASVGSASVSVRVTSDSELRALNARFLGEDHATDVLSFPSGSGSGSGSLDGDGYLGDIALSWEAVERQAAEFGHPVEAEAALLCVHGLLHLLGWDHATEEEEEAMTAVTLRALAAASVAVAPGRLRSAG